MIFLNFLWLLQPKPLFRRASGRSDLSSSGLNTSPCADFANFMSFFFRRRCETKSFRAPPSLSSALDESLCARAPKITIDGVKVVAAAWGFAAGLLGKYSKCAAPGAVGAIWGSEGGAAARLVSIISDNFPRAMTRAKPIPSHTASKYPTCAYPHFDRRL